MFLEMYSSILKNIIKYGLKPAQFAIFEIIRYFSVLYFKTEIDSENDDINTIFVKGGGKLTQMNILIEGVNKQWFDAVIKIMNESFYDYQNSSILKYVIMFICFIIIVIVYYFIIWRIYEEKLKVLLKESANLINLIPQEIKNLLIEKLNE